MTVKAMASKWQGRQDRRDGKGGGTGRGTGLGRDRTGRMEDGICVAWRDCDSQDFLYIPQRQWLNMGHGGVAFCGSAPCLPLCPYTSVVHSSFSIQTIYTNMYLPHTDSLWAGTVHSPAFSDTAAHEPSPSSACSPCAVPFERLSADHTFLFYWSRHAIAISQPPHFYLCPLPTLPACSLSGYLLWHAMCHSSSLYHAQAPYLYVSPAFYILSCHACLPTGQAILV